MFQPKATWHLGTTGSATIASAAKLWGCNESAMKAAATKAGLSPSFSIGGQNFYKFDQLNKLTNHAKSDGKLMPAAAAEKKKPPTIAELLEMRMEMAVTEADRLCDKIVKGEATQLERMQMRLLLIDQDLRTHKWADELRSEGRRVSLAKTSSATSFEKGMRITNRRADVVTVWLYGVIGAEYGGVSDTEFQQKFDEIPSDAHVALRIRSDGGDFYTALAMREVIIARLGKTVAYIDGLAASAATLVACACSKIVMGVGARFMIHEASAEMKGRVNDFEFAADELRKTNNTIAQIYRDRWKGTQEELREAMRRETWLDAEQAVRMGFADEISEKLSAAASLSRDFGYKSIPAQLSIAAKARDCPRLMAAQMRFYRLATVR